MNINIIKTFRQRSHKLHVGGQFVGTMNKWVDGAFGSTICWSVYSAGGQFVAYAANPEEAWERLFAHIRVREQVKYGLR